MDQATRAGTLRQIYATVLSTDDYLPAALQLDLRLKDVGSRHPFVIFTAPRVSPRTLADIDAAGVRRIALRDDSRARKAAEKANERGGMSHWNYSFEKLQLFDQQEFDRIVYLDSDMLVLSNLDELFERPHLSAVAAGRLMNPDYTRLNSGLIVIEPGRVSSEELMALVPRTRARLRREGRERFGDQDLLHTHAPDWPARPELHLGEEFNMFYADVAPCIAEHDFVLPGSPGIAAAGARAHGERTPIRVVHFEGPRKPWVPRYWVASFVRALRPGRFSPHSLRLLLKFARVYLAARYFRSRTHLSPQRG